MARAMAACRLDPAACMHGYISFQHITLPFKFPLGVDPGHISILSGLSHPRARFARYLSFAYVILCYVYMFMKRGQLGLGSGLCSGAEIKCGIDRFAKLLAARLHAHARSGGGATCAHHDARVRAHDACHHDGVYTYCAVYACTPSRAARARAAAAAPRRRRGSRHCNTFTLSIAASVDMFGRDSNEILS